MNGLRNYSIGISILMIFYLLAHYYKPKPTDWTASYLAEDKIPFGTYILSKRIADIFPNAKVKTVNTEIYSTLKDHQQETFNYLIIAGKIKVSKFDFNEMLTSLKAGNNIFIAANEIQGPILSHLKLQISSDFTINGNSKTDTVHFYNPVLTKKGGYLFKKNISDYYFSRLDTTKAIVLGASKQGRVNFVKFQFGKGMLYILPNPKLFTNYSLLENDGADYAAKALSHLPETKNLFIDEYFTKPSPEDQSVLRVLFQYDQLRWAYCISIFSLLIFVFFEVKRRQRVIPIIEPLKNTTVEFVEVVGSVYYQQRNNRDIAEKKVIYLLEYIRTKYRLKTNSLDTEFKNAFINISNIAAELVDELLQEIKYLQAGHTVSDQQLIRLNKLIERFYKQDQ